MFSVKRFVKLVVFGMALALLLPLILLTWLEKSFTRSAVLFQTFGQLLSLMPGLPGNYLRAAFYFCTLENCSWEVHIGFGCIFSHRAVTIAPRTSMGVYCVIGHANIGSDVRMASRISIPSGKRQHLDDQGRLSTASKFDQVVIGSNCWLGEGAIIMADVGAGSIVSSGAVVTTSAPESCLVGGNPARVLKLLDSTIITTDKT